MGPLTANRVTPPGTRLARREALSKPNTPLAGGKSNLGEMARAGLPVLLRAPGEHTREDAPFERPAVPPPTEPVYRSPRASELELGLASARAYRTSSASATSGSASVMAMDALSS